MFYDFEVNIPANTLSTAPVVQKLQIARGVIHYAEITFPSGCRGYVYAKILFHNKQILPTNQKASFRANGYTIPIREHLKIDEPPYTLTFVGWSDGSTYEHNITVRVGVLQESELEPLFQLPKLFVNFFKLLGVKSK